MSLQSYDQESIQGYSSALRLSFVDFGLSVPPLLPGHGHHAMFPPALAELGRQ